MLENALVGWIFITVELALALGVIAAKLWLERGGRGKRDAEAKKKCAEQLEKEKREAKEAAAAEKKVSGETATATAAAAAEARV